MKVQSIIGVALIGFWPVSRVKCPCKLKVDGNRTVECDGTMFIVKRTGKTDYTTFRCDKSRTHERATCMYLLSLKNLMLPFLILCSF